ncbi:hypothetical protein PUNSTDRAFT_135139 [Punctularia strigosozonata HHB-11173 SS5]|uniref:uncharacterized protein n=1 Tax=Punctularia strigosozonata (strain HHB-11173) TaxID=741275 RepID=UPI0004417692|nr:uncharacterized protein PUNSTDRAFT_135139 [Punctularia strigosozonata HHB-11173 SS5]EIN07617.1 hypothetical protein PUNSTDRAFT_135139 [Punctularia strigosozonata HHB-11173 SS5]
MFIVLLALTNPGQQQQHQSLHKLSTSAYSDGYRPLIHNILDISSLPIHTLHLTGSTTSPGVPSSNSHTFSLLQTIHRAPNLGSMPSLGTHYHQHHLGSLHNFSTPAHFNLTLLMLNSSMRFDPHPSQLQKQQPSSLSSSFLHVPSTGHWHLLGLAPPLPLLDALPQPQPNLHTVHILHCVHLPRQVQLNLLWQPSPVPPAWPDHHPPLLLQPSSPGQPQPQPDWPQRSKQGQRHGLAAAQHSWGLLPHPLFGSLSAPHGLGVSPKDIVIIRENLAATNDPPAKQ